MPRSIAAAVAAFLMCSAATAAAPSGMISKAKSLIADHMVDPSSVQYRRLRIIHQTIQGTSMTIACGDYNAKNRAGGYTGFDTFAYEPTVLKGVLSMDDDQHFNFFGMEGADEAAVYENADTTGLIYAACLGLKK
jgi:hypothetical protein